MAVGSGLNLPGYTLIAPAEQAAPLWQTLTEARAVPLGERAWTQLRIEQGRPMPGQELTEDYNPLEAGLWDSLQLQQRLLHWARNHRSTEHLPRGETTTLGRQTE